VTFRWLLTLPTVRMIDSPPDIDEEVEHLLETTALRSEKLPHRPLAHQRLPLLTLGSTQLTLFWQI